MLLCTLRFRERRSWDDAPADSPVRISVEDFAAFGREECRQSFSPSLELLGCQSCPFGDFAGDA